MALECVEKGYLRAIAAIPLPNDSKAGGFAGIPVLPTFLRMQQAQLDDRGGEADSEDSDCAIIARSLPDALFAWKQ